jgi:hypothetical protein
LRLHRTSPFKDVIHAENIRLHFRLLYDQKKFKHGDTEKALSPLCFNNFIFISRVLGVFSATSAFKKCYYAGTSRPYFRPLCKKNDCPKSQEAKYDEPYNEVKCGHGQKQLFFLNKKV